MKQREICINQEIKRSIEAAIKGLFDFSPDEIEVKHPALKDHGDYATNLALILAKKLQKSPLETAQLIAKKITISTDLVSKIEVVAPGFINFHLGEKFLLKEAKKLLDQKAFAQAMNKVGKGKAMVIDYSSPNIAKPFGIGHLRSTNIGQAIYNLYSFLGWKTIGDNHLGDWGTQFGKLIVAIKNWWPHDLEKLTIADLEKLYIKFHQVAAEKPELDNQAREWFKKLEDGDQEAKRIWQMCVDVSLKEFERVYRILGIKIDCAYGEAFYHFNDWMTKVLADVKEKGLLKKSQGALVIEIPGVKLPAMLVKSDGATTYLLRDLATLKFRKDKWQPDLVIYEVGADHKLHFEQVFRTAELLGYFKKDKLVHLAHGFIRWPHGKFSTRKGETIHLEEVIEKGIKRAKEIIAKAAIDKGLGLQEKEKIAQAVAISGIKFNDLKQEPQRDIIFDWEKILALEGYSAPYLQYTYARCLSVVTKAKTEGEDCQADDLREEEWMLLKIFYQFPEVILESAYQCAPYLLCQYLFELAQKFNLFYQKHRILGAEGGKRELRLFLTKVTTNILRRGLDLLGIEVLEKM